MTLIAPPHTGNGRSFPPPPPPPLPRPDAPGPAGPPVPEVPDAAAPLGSGLCRLSVLADPDTAETAGVRGRADLAVPSSTTPGELLPVLLARMSVVGSGGPPPVVADRWVLQRLGEEPLDPEVTLEAHDLLDGEVLHLRPAADPIPPIRYDDVPDGIADAVAERTDRWTPAATRNLLHVVAVVSLVAASAIAVAVLPPGAVAWTGFGVAAGFVAGALALLRLAGGAEAGERHRPVRGAALVALWSGVLLAVPAGLSLPAGPAAVVPLTPAGVLVAGLMSGGLAAVALLVGRTHSAGLGTVVGLAVTGMAVLGLDAWTRLALEESVAVVAVVLFLVASVGPRIAARVFGLRVPELPRNAPELGADIEPLDGDVVAARTARADALITVVLGCTAASTVLAAVFLRETAGWAPGVLVLLLALATALRGAVLQNVAQRTTTTLAGLLAACVLALGVSQGWGTAWGITLMVLAVLGAAGAVLSAWRLSGRRLLPIWGRLVEIGEILTAIALVPVLLQLLGFYGYLRGLNG